MSDVPPRLLIFRNGSIGNTLAAVPAIRALRKHFATAKIAVVVDAVGEELLRHCPYIDELIVYDRHGAHRGVRGFLKTAMRLRTYSPTHAVLFKRFRRNGLLAYLSGAVIRAGFRTNGSAPFLNLTVDYDEAVHVTQLNLRLSALLGAHEPDHHPEVFLSDKDRAFVKSTYSDLLSGGPFLCIHYGGLTAAPGFFPLDEFCDFLRTLSQSGFQLVLIGHGEREMRHADIIMSKVTATSAIGLSIGEMSALIEAATGFIGFNSGPMHIAAALSKRGVVFFRNDERVETELIKWKPLSEDIHVLLPPEPGMKAEWDSFLRELEQTAAHMFSTT